MQSLLHGLHAWHIAPEELKRVEQVQSKSLKRILELPESTPSAALFLETGIPFFCKEIFKYNLVFCKHRDLKPFSLAYVFIPHYTCLKLS